MKKIYVTKHSLTSGIEVYDWDGEISDYGFVYPELKYKFMFSLKLNRDAFLTEEEAKQDAEKRRVKKIASLQKQISKLEKLNFK